MSLSIPILAIPTYYVLAIIPHGVALSKASKGDISKHDNRNPKSTSFNESLRKRLTARELAAFERAESCHRNHLENMPLFVATVFAGMFAEQRMGVGQVGLLSFVYGWMAIRVLYTVNYLVTESQAWSQLRSALYFWGCGWSFLILWRSALALGA